MLRYLHAVDVEECHQRQATVAQQQRLEAAVAAAAGLAMVYSVPSLRLKPALTRFLEGLAAAAAEDGPIGGGRFRSVPLCIIDDQVLPLCAPCCDPGTLAVVRLLNRHFLKDTCLQVAEGESFSMDTTLGYLSAAVSSSAQAVYDYIQVRQSCERVLPAPWCHFSAIRSLCHRAGRCWRCCAGGAQQKKGAARARGRSAESGGASPGAAAAVAGPRPLA